MAPKRKKSTSKRASRNGRKLQHERSRFFERSPRRNYSSRNSRYYKLPKKTLLLAAGAYGAYKLANSANKEKDDDFNVNEDATRSQIEAYKKAKEDVDFYKDKMHKSQCEIEMLCLVFKGPYVSNRIAIIWDAVGKRIKELYKQKNINVVFNPIPLTSLPYVKYDPEQDLYYWKPGEDHMQTITHEMIIPKFNPKTQNVIMAWPILVPGHYYLITIYLDNSGINSGTKPKMYFNVLDGSHTVDTKFPPEAGKYYINTQNILTLADEVQKKLSPDAILSIDHTTKHFQKMDTVGLCSLFTLFGAWHFLTTPDLWTLGADDTMADLLYVTHPTNWNDLAEGIRVEPPVPRSREQWLRMCKNFREKAKFVYKQIGLELPTTLKQNRL